MTPRVREDVCVRGDSRCEGEGERNAHNNIHIHTTHTRTLVLVLVLPLPDLATWPPFRG